MPSYAKQYNDVIIFLDKIEVVIESMSALISDGVNMNPKQRTEERAAFELFTLIDFILKVKLN